LGENPQQVASFGFQQFEHFSPGHKQFSTHRATNFEFPELDQSVNTEIIDAEHVGHFMNGIGQPLYGLHLKWGFGFDKSFHELKRVSG
jgi:hypothetical protein